MRPHLAFLVLSFVSGCIPNVPELDSRDFRCIVEADCASGYRCVSDVCVLTAGDTLGGDSVNGDTAGGDTAGGDTAGGDTAGGDTTSGDTTSGDSAGGDTSNGDTVNGDALVGDSIMGDTGDAFLGDALSGDARPMLFVSPAYPSLPDWNHYILDDGSTPLDATPVVCPGDSASGVSACLHAGELRRADVPGLADCTAVATSDAVGAFVWGCDDGGPTVVVYSTGLAPGRGLGDLLNTSGFLDNSITVSVSGVEYASSAPDAWAWTNPVSELAAGPGGVVTLSGSNRDIHLLTSNLATDGYQLGADGIALVALPGATLTLNAAAADNCQAVTGMAGNPDSACVIAGNGRRFVWVEAEVIGGDYGVLFGNARANRIHRFRSENAAVAGLSLAAPAINNLLTEIRVDAAATGMLFLGGVGGRGNRVHGAAIQSSTANALVVETDNNTFTDIALANSLGFSTGAMILRGDANVLSRAVISNSDSRGLHIESTASDNVLTDLTIIGTASSCMYVQDDAVGNTLSHVTLLNCDSVGMNISDRAHSNAVVQTLILNTITGFRLSGDAHNTVVHTLASGAAATSSHNSVTVAGASSGSTFEGHLIVDTTGTPCEVTSTGPTPGVLDTTCTATGVAGTSDYTPNSSNATLSLAGPSLAGSIIGKAPFENTNSAGANPMLATITNWTDFDHRHRGFGPSDLATFPTLAQGGFCGFGSCQVWDASLSSFDSELLEFHGVFDGSASCPASASTEVTDLNSSPNTFLVSALEIFDDGVGDDDGLCESDERCVYSPAIGAYQGHGTVTQQACTFAGTGAVTGVQLHGYSVIGR